MKTSKANKPQLSKIFREVEKNFEDASDSIKKVNLEFWNLDRYSVVVICTSDRHFSLSHEDNILWMKPVWCARSDKKVKVKKF